MYLGNAQNIYNLGRGSRPCIAQTRGVSGFIEVGGQVVMKVVMQRSENNKRRALNTHVLCSK